jgi:predicted alpha-1,2-mannosidase
VQFEGGTAALRTIMATALYHSFVVPSLVTDVDGRYRGYDNAIHTADFDYHTNFSMWDTYRTVHPLLALVRTDQQRDLTRSLIQMAREGGYYPRWSMGHGYPNITAGSPADVVVGESFLRGVRGYDANEALDLMLKEIDNPPPPGHPHSGREGLADYLSRGYVPVGLKVPGVGSRVVVRTLEYNVADAAISHLAAALGRTADAARAQTWSQSYGTLWDPGTQVFRGKNPDGSWFAPFDEFNANEDLYYGANARQYSWLVPHDPLGLRALYGSSDALIARLQTFFVNAKAAFDAGQRSSYYTHENEPDIQAMYLFLAGGRPDLTQRWVDWAAHQFYAATRDGLPGNEDAGALSAWYVLSQIGLYPVSATDIWLIGRPAFPRISLTVAGGTLVIDAPLAGPERPYVSAVTLDGAPVTQPWLHHADLARGGVLHFDMSDQPQTWGNQFGSWER